MGHMCGHSTSTAARWIKWPSPGPDGRTLRSGAQNGTVVFRRMNDLSPRQENSPEIPSHVVTSSVTLPRVLRSVWSSFWSLREYLFH